MNRWASCFFRNCCKCTRATSGVWILLLSVSRPQVKMLNLLFSALKKVWLKCTCGFEQQIRSVQKKVTALSFTSRRSNMSLAAWTRLTCFKSRKAAWWDVTVTFWCVCCLCKTTEPTVIYQPRSPEKRFNYPGKAPVVDSWQPPTWSKCARLSSTLPCFALFSGTMKISAVVGNPGSTVTRSCSSLIPVTFNTDTKSSVWKWRFFLNRQLLGSYFDLRQDGDQRWLHESLRTAAPTSCLIFLIAAHDGVKWPDLLMHVRSQCLLNAKAFSAVQANQGSPVSFML